MSKKADNVYRDSRSGAVILTKYCFEGASAEEVAFLEWDGTFSSKLTFQTALDATGQSCDVTAVLSGSAAEPSRLFKTRFITSFKAWASLDGQNYTVDVPPSGRSEIPLPRKLAADGWTCEIKPKEVIERREFEIAKSEQTVQCVRESKGVGLAYGTIVEARAICVHSQWNTDQQTAVIARNVTKSAKGKNRVTITTTVAAAIGIGCATVDLNTAGAGVLLEPLFPGASHL